jgi:DNA-binding MarR family transcriptional regulator
MDISRDNRDALELLIGFADLGRMWSSAINQAAGFEVSDNQSVVLLTRMAIDGPVRPGEIVESTGLTSGGVTKLIARLEKRGLVKRSHGDYPDDRRAVRVTLTPKGEEVASHFADELRLRMRELEPLLKRFSRLAGDL